MKKTISILAVILLLISLPLSGCSQTNKAMQGKGSAKNQTVADDDSSDAKGNVRNGNIINSGLAAEDNDWVYFSSGNLSPDNSKEGIYKVNKKNKKVVKIYRYSADNLNVVGDWIYFTLTGGICRIKTDGSNMQEIDDKYNDIYFNMYVSGEKIYCLSSINDSQFYNLYCMNLDGSNKTKLSNDPMTNMVVSGNHIYYYSYHDKAYGAIYRIDMNGSNKKIVVDNAEEYFILSDGWIYYSKQNSDNTYDVCKIKTSGSHNKKLFVFMNDCLWNVQGDRLYAFDGYHDTAIRMRTDGADIFKTKISSISVEQINIAGDWIFIKGGGFFYKCRTDFSDLQSAASLCIGAFFTMCTFLHLSRYGIQLSFDEIIATISDAWAIIVSITYLANSNKCNKLN